MRKNRIMRTIGGLALLVATNFTHAIVIPLDQIPDERAPAQTTRPADLAYNEGIEAINRKDWSAARNAFARSLQHDPRHNEALLGMAHVAAQQDKLKEAEDWLKKALAANPQSAAAQLSWGRFLVARQRYADAEPALKKAATLAPGTVAPALALGDLYSSYLNDPKAAAETYRQAVAAAPEHAGARYGLGMALLALGQFPDAEAALKRALELTSNNPLPRLGLGRVYLAQGRHGDAMKAFNDVLASHRNLPAALIGRGDVHFGQQNFKAASQDFEQATRLAPQNAEAYLKLGMSLQAQQKNAAAEKAYLSAIRVDPKLALAYNNLAWMATQDKTRHKQGVTWAEKAVSLAPETAEYLDTLGWAYYRAGQAAQARDTLQRALAKDSRSADPHYHLGMVWLALGNTAEARKSFNQALAIRKDHAEARAALARLD